MRFRYRGEGVHQKAKSQSEVPELTNKILELGTSSELRTGKRLTVLPLMMATFFMVSGGPFGLEELISDAGYHRALLALLITPLIWSLPTALMVAELSAAIPDEGGFYVWVRRALGPFWGFQEAWLSLVASVFDMAIYPTLFVAYASWFWPSLAEGHRGFYLGAAVVTVGVLWNLLGSSAVGGGSQWLGLLLLSPFVFVIVIGVLAAMRAGVPANAWSTGSWTSAAGHIAGHWAEVSVAIAGMICGLGMFNALALSYSRLPFAMAEDKLLPQAFRKLNRNGVPWVALLVLGIGWMLSLGLSFSRLVMLDIMLYGLSLVLEFAALIVLRLREPELRRPFRVPGSPWMLAIWAAGPTFLIALSAIRNHGEKLGSLNALWIAGALIVAGVLAYIPIARYRNV